VGDERDSADMTYLIVVIRECRSHRRDSDTQNTEEVQRAAPKSIPDIPNSSGHEITSAALAMRRCCFVISNTATSSSDISRQNAFGSVRAHGPRLIKPSGVIDTPLQISHL